MLSRILVGAVALVLSAAPALARQEPAAAERPVASPPAAIEFSRELGVNSVDISPDGRHALAVVSLDGNQTALRIISLETPMLPVEVGREGVRIESARFLKNDWVALEVVTPMTGGASRGFRRRTYFTDLSAEDWREPLDTPFLRGQAQNDRNNRMHLAPTLLDDLPLDRTGVLAISAQPDEEGSVFHYDLVSGQRTLAYRGSRNTPDFRDWVGVAMHFDLATDLAGVVRHRRELKIDGGAAYHSLQFGEANAGWSEHFRVYARDRSPITVLGFDPDPNIAYVRARNGRDRMAVWTYDIAARRLSPEPVFSDPLFDVVDIIQYRGRDDHGRVLGYVVHAERPRTVWIEGQLEDIDRHARAALGVTREQRDWTDTESGLPDVLVAADDLDTKVVAWADDFRSVLIERSGPGQPPEFFILTYRRGVPGSYLRPFGEPPALSTGLFGDGRLAQFTARDGAAVPVFVVTPDPRYWGPGPWPTLLMVHDGPQARDDFAWDRNGRIQYFASRGYAVIQPQFRGSAGWGEAFERAGDDGWAGVMERDRDDAAAWAVAEGIAAADRIAISGFGYGGYAALVAAARADSPYQCAIAGAPISDLALWRRRAEDDRWGRDAQAPFISGPDPARIDAGDYRLPVLLWHGDRDEVVHVDRSREIADRLRRANRPHQLLVVPEMGHTADGRTAEHVALVLEETEAFLRRDCGPGGL